MRLFIALPVPEKTRRALEETQDALRKQGVRGRFTPSENLHLTLVFIGSARDPAPIVEALRQIKIPRTALAFHRLTLFGDVLVALLQRDEALEACVRAMRAALDAAGVRYDRQAFRPHITLCRKTALPASGFRPETAGRTLDAARLPVREVRLMASDLSGEKPAYSVVAAFPPSGR